MNNIERENWLKERKNYIGGSDIAAILGFSQYRSAIDVYLEKTSAETNNNATEAAERGLFFEDGVAKIYEEKTGFKVEIESNVIYHPEHKFLAANIDRWVDDKKYILECKTAHFMKSKEWGEEYTDQIPDAYLYQVAHYAAICDVPKVDIAVAIGRFDDWNVPELDILNYLKSCDNRIYTYIRNRELEDKIIKIACNFWNNHVLKGIPPVPTSINDTSALYPIGTNLTLEADSEISQKVAMLKELKNEEKNVCEAIKKLQFEIQSFMKDADVLTDSNGNCLATWKNTRPRISFNSKLLQKEHTEIYDKCISEVQGPRVFLIK